MVQRIVLVEFLAITLDAPCGAPGRRLGDRHELQASLRSHAKQSRTAHLPKDLTVTASIFTPVS
jgi:hypothetical protein